VTPSDVAARFDLRFQTVSTAALSPGITVLKTAAMILFGMLLDSAVTHGAVYLTLQLV
jgi:hypothetical protein